MFVLVVAVASAPLAVAAEAPDSAETKARAAFEQGRAAYNRGAFGEALAHFEHAQALSPRAELLYNIGRSADSDGQTARALSAYSAFLEAYPTAENREFVRARLEKVRALELERQTNRPMPPTVPVPAQQEDKPYKRHPPPAGRRNAFSAISPNASAQPRRAERRWITTQCEALHGLCCKLHRCRA